MAFFSRFFSLTHSIDFNIHIAHTSSSLSFLHQNNSNDAWCLDFDIYLFYLRNVDKATLFDMPKDSRAKNRARKCGVNVCQKARSEPLKEQIYGICWNKNLYINIICFRFSFSSSARCISVPLFCSSSVILILLFASLTSIQCAVVFSQIPSKCRMNVICRWNVRMS